MAGELASPAASPRIARGSSRRAAALRLLRRRLIQAVPLMLGVVVINFVLIQLAPGSFLELMTAENQVSDPATIELLRKTYGLDDPVWLQLVKYIWALMQFDFGFSYRQNRPVIEESYRFVLDTLDRHLRRLPFLLGARPSLADFGIYGQLQILSVDPTPAAEMRPN